MNPATLSRVEVNPATLSRVEVNPATFSRVVMNPVTFSRVVMNTATLGRVVVNPATLGRGDTGFYILVFLSTSIPFLLSIALLICFFLTVVFSSRCSTTMYCFCLTLVFSLTVYCIHLDICTHLLSRFIPVVLIFHETFFYFLIFGTCSYFFFSYLFT